jgi:hypothetical protein
MQQFLLILLIITGSAFIIQTIAGFAGLMDDVDVPGHGAGHFGFLTIRNMITFLLGFSSAGYILTRAGFPEVVAIIAGVAFGTVLAGSIIAGMRLLLRLEQKNEIEPHEYRGLYATVIVRIEPCRKTHGKIEFSLRDRVDEMIAVTDEEEPIAKGEQVQVIRLLDNGSLLVKRLIIN